MATGTNGIATRENCNTIYNTFSSDLKRCVTYNDVNSSSYLTTGSAWNKTTTTTTLSATSSSNVTTLTSSTYNLAITSIPANVTVISPYMSLTVTVTLNSPLPTSSSLTALVNASIKIFAGGALITTATGSSSTSISSQFTGTRVVTVTITVPSNSRVLTATQSNLIAQISASTDNLYVSKITCTVGSYTFYAVDMTKKLVKFSNIRTRYYNIEAGSCIPNGVSSTTITKAFGGSNNRTSTITVTADLKNSATICKATSTNNLSISGLYTNACCAPTSNSGNISATADIPDLAITVSFKDPGFYQQVSSGTTITAVKYTVNCKIYNNGTAIYTNSKSYSLAPSQSGSYWTIAQQTSTFTTSITDVKNSNSSIQAHIWVSDASVSTSGGSSSSSSSALGVWEE